MFFKHSPTGLPQAPVPVVRKNKKFGNSMNI